MSVAHTTQSIASCYSNLRRVIQICRNFFYCCYWIVSVGRDTFFFFFFFKANALKGLLQDRTWISITGTLSIICPLGFSSVQFSRSVMSDSLQPRGLQHARLPYPSSSPRACSNSCPSSQWCHPIISSSVVPFSSCLQSFPASGSFLSSQIFASGDQTIGASASASVRPVNIQDWCPLGWTGWISLQAKRLSSLLQHHSSKASILRHSAFFMVQFSHSYVTTEKTIALYIEIFVGKVTSLLFNTLSRLVIAFLPRIKGHLISWLQLPSAVIL